MHAWRETSAEELVDEMGEGCESPTRERQIAGDLPGEMASEMAGKMRDGKSEAHSKRGVVAADVSDGSADSLAVRTEAEAERPSLA